MRAAALGTLAANERDQPPLLGPEDPAPGTLEYRAAVPRLLEAGDPAGAESLQDSEVPDAVRVVELPPVCR